MRKLFPFFLLLSLSLFALACQKHDNPTAPQVSNVRVLSGSTPPSTFITVPNSSSIRARMVPLASDCLQPSATVVGLGWNPSSSFPNPSWVFDGNFNRTGCAGFSLQGMPEDQLGEFFLTWPSPQTISNIQIFGAGLWTGAGYLADWQIGISYKSSPEDSTWQSVPLNWTFDFTWPPYWDYVSFTTSFPAFSARVLRFSFRTLGSCYRHFYFSQIGVFGPPKSLKITSPANGAQLSFGENIQFTSQADSDIYNFAWSWDGYPFGTSQNAATSGISIGTHTITVTGIKSSDHSIVSDRIEIGIQPIVLEVTLNPTSVRPSQTPLPTSPTQPTTVTVTVRSGGNPVVGHSIRLTAAGVPGSGGHNAAEHDNGTRPIPDGNYGVFAANQGVTIAGGVFTTTYTPTRFGGSETITINSRDFPDASAVATLTVTVPALVQLPRNDASYIQIGGQNTGGPRAGHFVHPGPVDANSPVDQDNNFNHWGTQRLVNAIQHLANDFNAERLRRWQNAGLLQFNDMSLPNGGIFDINGTWANNLHADHREGINVDFNHLPLSRVQRIWLQDTIRDGFGVDPHPHPRPPAAASHWHLVLTDRGNYQ